MELRSATEKPRPLVWCHFGVHRFPLGTLLGSGFMAGVFTFFAFNACSPVLKTAASFLPLVAFWVLCTVFVFLVQELQPMLDAMRAELAADEGGCRITWRGSKSYWPFDLLGRCQVQVSVVQHDKFLLRDRTDRTVFEVALYGKSLELEAAELASAVTARRENGERHLEGAIARLGRNGLTMEEWLRALDAEVRATRGGEGFRARNVDWDSLLAAVNDVTLSVEDRAGAAYMLARADRLELRAAVREACKDSWPPLVTAMLAIAVPGPKDALAVGGLQYLDALDIALLEQHARQLETD